MPMMLEEHTGAPITTWIGFPAGAVRWVSKEATRYRSSKDVERSFCPACGSTVGFHRVHETSLAIGSLDAPAALPVTKLWTGHVWFKEHIPWFDTADNWARYSDLAESMRPSERGGRPLSIGRHGRSSAARWRLGQN